MISLNNRETAWLVWLGGVFLAVLAGQATRNALWQLVKVFCSRWILGSVALMLGYIGVCVIILAALHIWQWDNLKTTLIWCATFAFVTMMDVNRISEDDGFYRKTIRDTLSGTALVLFVAEFESFSLLAELIILPGLVFLGACVALVQIREELKSVKGLVEGIAAIAFLWLLIASVTAIWQDPNEFFSWATLREYLVPVLLSLLFLPFMYLLSTYFVFERITQRLSFVLPDANLRRYGHAKAVFAFWGDLDAARRWSRDVGIERSESREDVDRSIREVLEAKRREKSRPDVPITEGWSPYEAKAFLESEGLKTDDYHKSYDDMWHASSMPLEVDKTILPSTIDYVVEGNRTTATRLKLKLRVVTTAQEDEADKEPARKEFARIIGLLMPAAAPDISSEPIIDAMMAGAERVISGQYAEVRVSREDWKNRNVQSYELLVSVVHHRHAAPHHSAKGAI